MPSGAACSGPAQPLDRGSLLLLHLLLLLLPLLPQHLILFLPLPLLLVPARAVWPSGWLVNIQHAALSECYQRKHLRTKKQTEIILHLLSLCHLRCPNLHPGVLLEERVLSGLWLVALGPSFSNRTERKKNNRRQQSFPGTRRRGTDAVAHGLGRNT